MSQKAKELCVIAALLVLSLSILFGFYGQTSRTIDLATRIAFAFLVTAVTGSLKLLFDAMKEPDHAASFKELGMLHVFNPLGDATLRKHLAGARGEIKILKTWFPENETLERGLEAAIKKKKVRVKLLLAHPDSALLARRSDSANKQPGHGPFMVLQAPEWPWIEVEEDSELDVILTRQFETIWSLEDTLKFSTIGQLAQWLAAKGTGESL